MKKLLPFMAAMALTGCVATMSAAPAGSYSLKDGTSMTLQHAWTHIPDNLNATNGSIMTKDGMSLNQLYILTVEPEGKMVTVADKSQEYPEFEAGSSELKQIEFITANLSRLGFENVKTLNVSPTTLSGMEGVQFDLTGNYASGLNMKGKVALAESEAGLHTIIFMAPATYYYDRDVAEVDAIIESTSFGS